MGNHFFTTFPIKEGSYSRQATPLGNLGSPKRERLKENLRFSLKEGSYSHEATPKRERLKENCRFSLKEGS